MESLDLCTVGLLPNHVSPHWLFSRLTALTDQRLGTRQTDCYIPQVREEIDLANLANQYLRDMIRKECWDAMVVKGRSVNAFHLPLSVSNYPMKERTKAELEEIQYVSNQRKIEQAEYEASKDVVSGPASARNTPLVGKNKLAI